MRYEIKIQAGRLVLDIQREEMPLDVLLGFASRQNPKRGYLFVSKVLGKHIPCRPSLMRQVYDRLAERLSGLSAPVTLIGMAETATGLGAGVAHSLACGGRREQVLYLHTTRYRLATAALITFDENHSHAPDHILYAPGGEGAELFRRTATLVLVDDEISTGRTLGLLARRIATHMPELRRIVMLSLVNWLDVARYRGLSADLSREIDFVSLLQGSFEFYPDPAYRPILPPGTKVCRSGRRARLDTGRTGLLMPEDARCKLTGFLPEGPLVMVGTGEFSFAPFLAAEELERRGRDVLFQSTTRSPILQGDAIASKLMFPDEYDEGVLNYIYNLPLDRRIIVAYEHPELAVTHDFPAMVDAQVWALS